MAYGTPATIKAKLNSAQIGGVFYLVEFTQKVNIRRVAEREITWGGNTYEPMLIRIEGLERDSRNNAQTVEFTLANADGVAATWDQTETFLGARVKIYEYVQSADGTVTDAYLKWQGICDEVSEVTWEHVTIPAQSGAITVRLEAPKRMVSPQCQWVFGNVPGASTEIPTGSISVSNFEGFECPYGKDSNTGFKADLAANMDATTDPITFTVTWTAGEVSNGGKFSKGDLLIIDSEVLEITNSPADPVSNQQSLTCSRAKLGTSKAAHTSGTNNVAFKNCQKAWESCKRRGMRGNNSLDAYSGTNRNYFGGFPILSNDVTGSPHTVKRNKQKILVRPDFLGNRGAMGSSIPLVYGNTLVTEPVLLASSDQGDFLTTLWAFSEGVIATNANNDTISANPLDGIALGPDSVKHILVNGKHRHDDRAQFGIELWMGQRDAAPPGNDFFSTPVAELQTDKLAFWGTAWYVIKINKEANEQVTPESGITSEIETAFGRIVRVYSAAPSGAQTANDPTLFTRKATNNGVYQTPAWVLLDYEASKRGGGGLDYKNFDIQSFIDLNTYCAASITSVIDGSSQPRWTFNGSIVDKRSFQDWERLICLGANCTVPFVDVNGKLKVKALKKETPVAGAVPFFSDKSGTASERAIMWENGKSTLRKFRKPLLELPNRIIVNYIEQDSNGNYINTQGIMDDETIQRRLGEILGDNSIRIVSKTVDLIGLTTRDEAARMATILLRAGEFAQGGQSNNNFVEFQTLYKLSNDIEVGDVIEVQSSLLDTTKSEQFYRVIKTKDDPISVEGGGFVFARTITGSLYLDAIYDDASGPLTTINLFDGPVGEDGAAPPVTSPGIVETGIFDGNNKLMSELTFTYTAPSPKENFKNVTIWRSTLQNPNATYDAVSNPANDDWRMIGELYKSGDKIQWEISNTYVVYSFVSKNLNGVTPKPTLKTADGSTFKYPRISVLMDGVVDVLPAPSGYQIFVGSGIVTLKWNAYTGNNLKLFKYFEIARNTSGTGPNWSTEKIAETDGTTFVDTSVAASTTYYYWVRGFSIVLVGGTATSSLNTTSPSTAGADTGVPTAPTVGALFNRSSYNANEVAFLIGVEKPGGASNWGGVYRTELQMTTDQTFATFPAGKSLNLSGANALTKPPTTQWFNVNYPGVYYIRARVSNSFGDSAWSSTLTRTTHIADNLTADTGIPPAPDNLDILTTADEAAIAGNQFKVVFEIPTTNTGSYWGYSVYVHDSATLPTATTQETGTQGETEAGSVVLTDTSKAWTVNAYANKDIVIFDPTRGVSPTFDYEGLAILAKIVSNTATTITFDMPAERQYRTYKNATTGYCKYYIVNRNATHHFWEKLKFSTPALINEGVLALTEERSTRKRSLLFNSSTGTLHVWVALYNLFGQGKVASGTPPNATYDGISTNEIKLLAVNNGRIANTTIAAAKMNVVNLSEIHVDLGSITAGTVTGTIVQTVSGTTNRVRLDATDGLTARDGGGTITTQITTAGILKVNTILQAVSNSTTIQNTSGNNLTVSTSTVSLVINEGNTRFEFNNHLRVASGHGYCINSSPSTATGMFGVAGTSLDFYIGGVETFGTVNNGSSSVNSPLYITEGGTLKQVKYDNSDLGSGTKKYLYV